MLDFFRKIDVIIVFSFNMCIPHTAQQIMECSGKKAIFWVAGNLKQNY